MSKDALLTLVARSVRTGDHDLPLLLGVREHLEARTLVRLGSACCRKWANSSNGVSVRAWWTNETRYG